MIVLDASILIAFLNATDAHHSSAKDILSRSYEEDLGANSMTLAEVLVGPIRAGKSDEAQSAIEDLAIEELPFPVNTATKLASLRASSGLKMPDCCVVLAAEESRASVATFDDQLARVARERGLTVHTR